MESYENRPDSDELMGPELSQAEIADMKILFQSVVEAVGLRECCADIIYSNWMHFSTIIQRKHAPDIIIQVSKALTDGGGDLRIRIELFEEDTRPGMTGLDYLKPENTPDEQHIQDTAARSVLLSANQEALTPTVRQLLVKIKATLIQESRLSPEDVPGEEGRSDYSLEDMDVIFAGTESLWASEAIDLAENESPY